MTVDTNRSDRFPETAVVRFFLDPEPRNLLTNETRRGVNTWRSCENSTTDCGIISKSPTPHERNGRLAQGQSKKERFTPTGLLATSTSSVVSMHTDKLSLSLTGFIIHVAAGHKNAFLTITNLGDGHEKNLSGLRVEVPRLFSRHALERIRLVSSNACATNLSTIRLVFLLSF